MKGIKFNHNTASLGLDESYEMCAEQIDGLNGIILMPHQRTSIAALLHIEKERKISYKPHYNNPSIINYTTNAAVLADSFGSGKTFTILGLILLRPEPLPPNTVGEGDSEKYVPHVITQPKDAVHARMALQKTYTKDIKYIRPNLIVVGSSVLNQWLDTIETFTNLKVFSIVTVKDVERFYYSLTVPEDSDDHINKYDIVMIKNGTVVNPYFHSKSVQLPITKVKGKIIEYIETRTIHMLTVISYITHGYFWSRIIIDDYDTIKIPAAVRLIPANFYIYVSATTKETRAKTRTYPVWNYELPERLDISTKFSITDSLKIYKKIYNHFKVFNKEEFYTRAISATMINYRKSVFESNTGRMVRSIIDLIQSNDNADLIIEAINGGAFKDVSDQLNMQVKNVSDLLQSLLGKSYSSYIDAKIIVDNTAGFSEHEIDNIHGESDTSGLASKLKSKEYTAPVVYTKGYYNRVMDIRQANIEIMESEKVAVERVVNNIQEGECQVCYIPLSDSHNYDDSDKDSVGVSIMKCCGVVFCNDCYIKGSNFTAKKGETLPKGRCAHCRTKFTYGHNNIFIRKNFNIDHIANMTKYKADELQDMKIVEDEDDIDDEDSNNEEDKPELSAHEIYIRQEYNHMLHKLMAMIDIINGSDTIGEEFSPNIPSILRGIRDVPITETTDRKIIIFANYSETLNAVKDVLDIIDCNSVILSGRPNDIANSVAYFRDNLRDSDGRLNILLVNAAKYCAGLNLQFASHIIFMHKIIDPNVEGQVIGRCQRFGRTHNLTVHYLLHSNELEE